MKIKLLAFLFFMISGIMIALGIHLIAGSFKVVSEISILGLPLSSVVAILVAVPAADWLRRKAFGPRSFGDQS